MRNETHTSEAVPMAVPGRKITEIIIKSILAVVAFWLFMVLVGEEAEGVHMTLAQWLFIKGKAAAGLFIIYRIFMWLERK